MVCSFKGAVTRGIMLCLILCATGAAWADGESLAETGGYVLTSAPALAFKNVTLEQIGTQYALSGRIGGGYISSDVKGSSTLPCNRYSYTGETALRYEMQVLDGSIVKCVRIKFTQVGADVYAQAIGAAAGDNGSNYWLGMQFQEREDNGTVKNYYQAKAVDTANGGGYGIYGLQLSAYPELLYRFDFDSNADNNGGTCGSAGLNTQGTLKYTAEKKKFGTGALSLNNVDSSLYVQNSTSGIVSKEDGWTVSFWVCPNGMSNWRDACGITCGNVKYKIEKNGQNAFQMYNDQNDSTNYPSLSTVLSYDDNSSSWVNIVLVAAANDNGFDIYKNGSFVQHYNQNDGDSSVYGTKTEALMRVCAGVYGVGDDRTSSALIDEVSVYKGALNATEIAYLAANTVPFFQRIDSSCAYSLPSGAGAGSDIVISVSNTPTIDFPSDVTANGMKFMSSSGGVTFAGTKPTATLDYSGIAGEVTYPWTWSGGVSSRTGGLKLTGGAGTSESPIAFTPAGGSITFDGNGSSYYITCGYNATSTEMNITDANMYISGQFGLAVGTESVTIGGASQVEANRVVLSQGGNGRTASLTIKDSAKLTVTGTSNVNNNQASIMFGHWNGQSTFTLQGSAEFYAPDTDVLVGVTRNNHTINIEGGVFTAKGIKLATYATGSNVLNLSGGELKLGESGIGRYGSSETISVNVTGDAKISTLTDSTSVPITQAVTVSANKTLTLDGGGTITFTSLTLNSGATLVLTNGTTVAINGGTIDDSAIIRIGTDSSLNVSSADLTVGQINCDSGGSLSVASGKTLTIKNGGSISGTVRLNSGGTLTIYGDTTLSGANTLSGNLNIKTGITSITTTGTQNLSGTITIDAGATLRNSAPTSDALKYGSSGTTVNIYGTLDMGATRWTVGTASNNEIHLYEDGVITGTGDGTNGALDWYNGGTLYVHGTSTISANMRCRDNGSLNFDVASGVCTMSGELYGNRPITKTGSGTLKLAYTGSNESYNLPVLSAGTIDFAGTKAWNVNAGEHRNLNGYTHSGSGSFVMSVTQTAEEYGKGSDIVVTDIPSGLSSITINKRGGGESEDITVSEGAATLTGSGDVAIAGDATIYDITFANNSSDTKDSGNFTHTCGTGTLKYDTTPTFNNSEFDETTGVYLKHHPYIDGAHSIFNSLTDFTVVVVGTMSPTAKTMFIHFGSSSSSNPGLLIATTDTANEVVIATTTGSTVNDGPGQGVTAKIPNAATARHAFVVAKSGTTLTVYADGIKRGTFTVAEGFKLGVSSHSGMQVGSDFGGEIAKKKEYNNVDASSGAETGVINVIRVFDYAISEDQALEVTRAYPYVPQGGLYTRTISADANLSAAGAWAKDGSEETFDLPEGATVSEQFFDPSATLTVSEKSTLAVNADLHLETLTIEGSAPLSIVSDGSHAIYPTTAVINSPVTNSYGAVNLNGTTVQFNSTGALCIDCSGLDISEVFTRTTYQLTGVIDEDAERFSVILPTATSRTATLNYNSNGFYEIEVTPDREGGIDVYYKEGYWSSSEKTFKVTSNGLDSEVVFPGDTVVVDSKSSQNPMYFGSSLPVNVAAIKIAKDIRIASGNTDGLAILGGATVTVADGFTLTIQRNSHNINLGAVVLNKDGANGTGAVVLDANNGTITVSGAITGTAPIAIAENKSVTVAATGSIDNTVELKSGSTLVVNSGATVDDVVTNVAHSRVVTSELAGVTTYRVELIPGTIFSVW